MHDNSLRGSVRNLRSKGYTYREILTELKLKLPKSTMSDWCRDVAMPVWYQAKVDELNRKNLSIAKKRALIFWRIKHEKLLANLSEKNKNLFLKMKNREILRMLLAMLYLGEGRKKRGGLTLGSSEPDIIRIYLRLLSNCYGLRAEKLKCRVSYRADQDIQALEKYWSGITGVPLENFYKTIPDPRTVGRPTKNLDYKGVCVIITGHADIQLELELIAKIILKGL